MRRELYAALQSMTISSKLMVWYLIDLGSGGAFEKKKEYKKNEYFLCFP